MIDHSVSAAGIEGVESVMRDELARGDAMAESVLPILRHLIAAEDSSVFSDEILARVRGVLSDLASALLDALAAAGGDADKGRSRPEELAVLTEAFVDNPQLLTHVHALALEWQLTEKLQARLALDPVVSPLLQTMIASAEPATQALAMTFLASQARWCQAQRRMRLPLAELPGDLFHAVLMTVRTLAGESGEVAQQVLMAETQLRQGYDESANRLGLAARLMLNLGGGAHSALSVSHAGVALFLTALALGSGQARDTVVLSTHEAQLARLALALRAAGLKPAAIEQQFLTLHPDVVLPPGFERIGPDGAAALLSAGRYAG